MINNSVYMLNGIGDAVMTEGAFAVHVMTDTKRWNSVVVHCCTGISELQWIAPLNGSPNPCNVCDQFIPESVITAWILHNFDKIQRSEDD